MNDTTKYKIKNYGKRIGLDILAVLVAALFGFILYSGYLMVKQIRINTANITFLARCPQLQQCISPQQPAPQVKK